VFRQQRDKLLPAPAPNQAGCTRTKTVNLARHPGDVLVVGAGRRGPLARMIFSKVGRHCLAHAQCPVLAIPPPVLAQDLRHGRLAWLFWHRPLTPEQVLRDQPKPAA